ncbi:hypothetical protein Ae201684P_017589 [Aphanomyces euteiches]|nr:hypothetical protein Ae201684P_017589 [Aphanomyces euteiches]
MEQAMMEESSPSIIVRRHRRDDKQSQRMAQYREQKKQEFLVLEQSISKLERIRTELLQRAPKPKQKSLLLPWKEVAKALRDLRSLGESQNKDLRSQLQRHQKLVEEMVHWVSLHYSIEKPPSSGRRTWRHVSLLADLTSRKLGKEWITQQMFHNTDRVFQEYGFPSIDATAHLLQDFHFLFSEDQGYRFITRHFTIMNKPMDAFVEHYRNTLLPFQCCILGYDSDTTPMLVNDTEGNIQQLALVTPRGEHVNLLTGDFRTPDRIVFLGRQIQDDELHRHENRRQRDRMFWCDLHRMPDGTCRGRGLWIQSQAFRLDGVVPLEEDGFDYDIDYSNCPDHLKEVRLPNLFVDAVKRNWASMLAKQGKR